MRPADQGRPVTAEAASGFPPPLTLRRRLAVAACVVGVHALVLAAALYLPNDRHRPAESKASPLAVIHLADPAPPPPSPPRRPPDARPPAPIAKTPQPTEPATPLAPAPQTPPLRPQPPSSSAPARPAPAPVPAASPAAPATPPPKTAPSARNDAYARSLWQRIAAHRPSGIALQGTVLLAFRLDTAGRLIDAHIAHSSGIPLLDRMALNALRHAAPFPPPPPEEAAQTGLDFTVPVNFL